MDKLIKQTKDELLNEVKDKLIDEYGDNILAEIKAESQKLYEEGPLDTEDVKVENDYLDSYINKLDDMYLEEQKLLVEKMDLEKLAENNPELKRYIEIINSLEAIEEKRNNYKEIYDDMVDADITKLSGKYYELVLKKPYMKKSFNTTLFKEKEKKLYEKYLVESQVKGSVSLKLIK